MNRSILIVLCFLSCLSLAAKPNVYEQAVLYPSVDQHGNPLELSGSISVPQGKTPKGVILLPHYTICSNAEAPSNTVTVEAGYFNEDYVLVMPDYIGYGVTADRVHPYLAGELTARNTVDMLLGVQPLLDSLAPGVSSDSIYIIGVSQGGASALWTLKLIEEEYADQIYVIKCFAGSGPYDVAVTHDEAVRRNAVGLPATIAMLVIGTDVAYDLGLNYDEFFTPAMSRAYTRYIKDKQMNLFPMYFRMPQHRLDHWFTAQGTDKSNPATQILYAGLLRSSLVHYPLEEGGDSICPSWIPKTPMFIFHSTNDDIVTFRCAENLHRCFADVPNITWDFGKYGNHFISIRKFFSRVQKLLAEE